MNAPTWASECRRDPLERFAGCYALAADDERSLAAEFRKNLAQTIDARPARTTMRFGHQSISNGRSSSHAIAGNSDSAGSPQPTMPQRRMVRASMVRKRRFSTVKPIAMTVSRPANTFAVSSAARFS